MAENNALALEFDGVDDYVDCGNDILEIHDEITIEARINLFNLYGGDNFKRIIEKATGGYGENGFSLFISQSPEIRFDINGHDNRFEDTEIIEKLENNRSHIAVTYNEKKLKIFIDGSLEYEVEQSVELSLSNEPMFLGASTFSDDRNWEGIIGEVRIWNRSLTQSEIQNNMKAKLSGYEPGLIAYYRCADDSDNTVLVDSSRYKRHGEINGATYVAAEVDLSLLDIYTKMVAVDNVTTNSADLTGELTRLENFSAAECFFQYADNIELENGVMSTEPVELTATGQFSKTVENLVPGKTYYFQAVANGVE